jgi:hypothetical protein
VNLSWYGKAVCVLGISLIALPLRAAQAQTVELEVPAGVTITSILVPIYKGPDPEHGELLTRVDLVTAKSLSTLRAWHEPVTIGLSNGVSMSMRQADVRITRLDPGRSRIVIEPLPTPLAKK